jgi:hypothetical protein
MSLVLGVDIVDVSSQRPPCQAFLRSNSFTALNIFQLMIITMICSLTALLEKANSKPTINQIKLRKTNDRISIRKSKQFEKHVMFNFNQPHAGFPLELPQKKLSLDGQRRSAWSRG